MPETVTQTETPPTAIALRVPWRDAARDIHAHLKIGRAIKNQRIRDQWELDHARAEKAEWIRRTTDLLKQAFTNEAVAEQCAQYAGTVLPEFAEFELFIDQFEDEMRHRLGLLQAVLTQLDTLPEALPSASGDVQGAEKSAAAEAIVIPEVEVEADEPTTIMQEIEMSAVATEATIGTVLDEASRPMMISPPPARRVEAGGLLILATSDESARRIVSDFLNDLGFKIDVIDRTAAPGKSVTELLGHESRATFAVVVADAAAIKEAAGEWQFELGFCAGRLGAGRVCVASATSEALGDKHGIRHVAIDGNGGWQLQMARYLKRAGVAVDLNRLC
jgi:hypothetical protein